jgi:3-phosphoshikimate 1-carboxyvinyltransferase
MDLIVGPSRSLRGTVRVPPNKSHSFRALIMAALAEGASRIRGPAVSSDWMRGIEAMEMLGASVTPHAENVWEVTGTGGRLRTPDDVINCGNSGIILRFFAALAACCSGHTVLTGDHSIRHIRPCGTLIDALNALGAWAVSTKGDGKAPVVVRGPLDGGRAELDGADSQPVSALLIAACLGRSPTELIVADPGEKPWVELTLHWLRRVGVDISHQDYQRYFIPGRARWAGFETDIPGDWSAAMYPIVAALICPGSSLRVAGVDPEDVQGDKAVIDVLRSMGGRIDYTEDGVVAQSSSLKGREIDCNDFVDMFLLLAVVGACAEGETVLTNAEICRRKECDRIAAAAQVLSGMGADVEELPDGLRIRGGRLRGQQIDSRDDHRVVMTMALAGLVADGDSRISRADCVKKTFPQFAEAMAAVGADMQKQ